MVAVSVLSLQSKLHHLVCCVIAWLWQYQ